MRYLKEIVRLVHQYDLEYYFKQSLEKAGKGKKTLYDKLYTILKEWGVESEEEIMEGIYGDQNERKKFSALKERFFEKISTVVFWVDPEKEATSTYKKHDYLARKYYMLTVFVKFLGFNNASFHLAKKTKKIADKYEFSEINYLISNFLVRESGTFADMQRFKYYKNEAERAIKVLHAENTINNYYQKAKIQLKGKTKIEQWQFEELHDHCIKAEKARKKWNTFALNIYETRLKYLNYSINYQFQKIIELWESFDNYVKKVPRFYSPVLEGQSYIMRLFAAFNLRDLEKAEYYADLYKEKLFEGRFEWFAFNGIYFILKLHKEEYSNAISIYESTVNHPKFSSIPKHEIEKWQIFKGFLHLILEANWNPSLTAQRSQYFPKFKINKFLNEVPTLSKDKTGENVNILILQILIFLARDQIPKIMERAEPLKNYHYRYLRGRSNRRLDLFVRMLLKAIKKQFDPEETIKATQKDYDELKSLDQVYDEGFKDLEVIPFETLWGWVLEHSKKFQQNKYHIESD